MKICLINNLYKPYVRGGADRVVEMIAERLRKGGHETVIISTTPKFQISNFKFKIIDGVKNYQIFSFYYNLRSMPYFLRLFWHLIDMFDIGSFMAVKKILKKEKPNLAMTHNLKGVGYLIPRAIKSLEIKHIHVLHDIQLIHPSGLVHYGEEKKIDGAFAKIYAALCRLLFGSPYAVISPSKWLLKMHEDRGFFKESKRVVLNNPVDVGIKETRDKKQETKGFKFFYVGQIEEHKGILFLIEAFKKLFPSGSPDCERGVCELIVVGDGSRLEEAKSAAGGFKNIKFLGRRPNEETRELMSNSDCLVMPSLCYENSPTVIYEAFAAGLPVIGADLGGIPELLADGRGILFKPGNVEYLANKMQWAVENREQIKKTAFSGRQFLENLQVESYIDRILSV